MGRCRSRRRGRLRGTVCHFGQGNALLTIQPGVIIAFEGEESGIFATEGGGIKAIGTEADPIKLKGTSENKGVWKGIYFASNHPRTDWKT